MATQLTKPISRLVATSAGRELIVTLTQAGITFREKGRRLEIGPIPYGPLYVESVWKVSNPRPAKKVTRNVLAL